MQPQYPQQYAPPAPQPYPAQQPPMPQYPGQAPPSVQQHYPPVYPGQPYPQQYAPPVPVAPAGPPPPPATLDGFYSQPSGGGGPAFKFMDAARQPQIGKSYEGFVARPITDADVRHQTDQQGNITRYRDGRPKQVMVVPMQVQPSQEFPDGQAGWWVKGQARDELARAMAEAGAPQGPPEAGAFIRVMLVGVRPVPNMNPQYQYRVDYRSPNGAPAAPVASPTVAQPAPQVPQQYATPYAAANPGHGPYGDGPGPQYAAPSQGGYPAPPAPAQLPPVPTGPAPGASPAPAAQQPTPQPVAQVPAPGQMPAGLTAEQQALFASLTGGTAAPAQPAS